MKKLVKLNLVLLSAGFILLMQSGCKSQGSNTDDAALTTEVNQVLNDWHKSAAMSDHAKYIGTMAEGGVYIGTDATEYWTTPEFSQWSKPYFDRKKGWNLVSLKRNIYVGTDRKTAWFDELLDTGMGLCRGSGVLQKINGEWKIFQYILSPTIPNNLTQQVKDLKAAEDSIIIQSLKSTSGK